jgi:hypothetical protein
VIVPRIVGIVIRSNLRQLKKDFYRDNAVFTNIVDLPSQCMLASKKHFLMRDEASSNVVTDMNRIGLRNPNPRMSRQSVASGRREMARKRACSTMTELAA